MKILIFGLPGAGKTWLAERLQKELNCAWFNADEVRRMANDWEFGDEARVRQARRMRNIANYEKGCGRDVICDFVCPTELTRHIFEADITVWVDTIEEGRFEDTNKMFERPNSANIDFHITTHLSEEDGEVKSLATAIEQRYVLDTEFIPV
jgi:adenylylsulfate kinase